MAFGKLAELNSLFAQYNTVSNGDIFKRLHVSIPMLYI